MQKMILWFVIVMILCTGCSRKKEEEPVLTRHLAQQITITCHHGTTSVTHTYSSDTSMSEILNYIRQLNLADPAPEDSGIYQGTRYDIRISCDDGSRYLYTQNAGRYFQNRGVWMQLPKEKSHLLPILFYQLVPDPA